MKRYHAITILLSIFSLFCFFSDDDLKERQKEAEHTKEIMAAVKAHRKAEYNRLAKQGYQLTGFNSEMK